MVRKEPLITGEIYHVMNKSIAEYKIFHTEKDYNRLLQMLRYFRLDGPRTKFSQIFELSSVKRKGFDHYCSQLEKEYPTQVQIIAYCLMPTHLHLVLKQTKNQGISNYLGKILNAYARFFNTKHKRKGPLWVGRFKNVLVKTDEQLLHLTRYLHLNPVSAALIKKVEKWPYSSYQEYIFRQSQKLCDFKEFIKLSPKQYRSFTQNHASYQRDLATIKKLVLE